MPRLKGRDNPRFLERKGQRRGRWTYIDLDPSRSVGDGVWWLCVCDCGITRSLPSRATSKSCGCLQKEYAKKRWQERVGDLHPNWKGGKTSGKYVRLLMKGHPRANKAGYVSEHVLVMEKMIGRYVLRTETVHHKNGITTDNRPENLELWDHSHPSGQRHSDKMKFYMSELLKKCDRKRLVEFCSEVLK